MFIMRSPLYPDHAGMSVGRATLLDRAIAEGETTVTYLHAPAGYGKTTLLKAWRQEDSALNLYVDGDFVGNDPACLLEEVARGLDASASGKMPGPPGSISGIADEIAALLDRSSVKVLILDHHHWGNSRFDLVMSEILARSTGCFHLIVASRAPGSLPRRPGMRSWASSAIDKRNLTLTRDKLAAMFATASGLDTEQACEICEGWPIVAEAMCALLDKKPQADAGELAAILADPEGGFASFVSDHILSDLTETDIELLTRTSFLERLTPALATAVAGDADSWRGLDRMRKSGLIELCETKGNEPALRCQSVIRALLLRRLEARGARAVRRLHHRAAIYFLRTGDLKAALRHAFKGGSSDLSTFIFLKAGGVAIGLHDGYGELQASLDLLPSASLVNPRVRVALAALMIKGARTEIGLEILREVSTKEALGVDDPLLLRDIRLVELLAIACGVPSLGAVEGKLEACLRMSPSMDHASMQGVTYNLKCLEAIHSGDLRQALVCADTAALFYRAAGAENGLAHIQLHSAHVHRARGETDCALEKLRNLKRCLAIKDSPDLGCLAHADLLLGAIYADRGELSAAAALCTTALPCAEASERHWEGLYAAYLILGAAADAVDNPDDGANELQRGLTFARANDQTELAAMIELRLVQRAIFDGSVWPEEALGVLKATEVETHWMVRHARIGVQAHLLALAGQTQAGLSLLRHGLDECLHMGLLRTMVDFLLDRVVILERTGQRSEAIGALREALRAAERPQLISPFVERREFIHSILIQVQVEQSTKGRTSDRASFSSDVLCRLFAQEDRGKANLSTKERLIMSNLAAGRSNKEIARNLKVSPETIRFHLKNVYSKLGINAGRGNRQIAADFARQHIDSGNAEIDCPIVTC